MIAAGDSCPYPIFQLGPATMNSIIATIELSANGGLRTEIIACRQLRDNMSSVARSSPAQHIIAHCGATDVSSIAGGGVTFTAAANFPAEWVTGHINVKET